MAPATLILPERKLTESDAAEMLDVKRETLRTWRCLGKGPAFVRIGRNVRYLRADLEAFLAAGRVVPTAVTAE